MKSKKQIALKGGRAMDVLARKCELKELAEEFKRLSVKHCRSTRDPELIAEEGAKLLHLHNKLKGKNPLVKKALDELMLAYGGANNLDSDLLLIQGVDDRYRGIALDFVRDLKIQHNLSSSQDKAYAQMAVLAYCRYQSDMRQYDSWKDHEFNSNERVAYMNLLSKDADRAFRQFNAVMQYFESKKHPKIQVNVRANTAFFAQNQQNINSTPNDERQ